MNRQMYRSSVRDAKIVLGRKQLDFAILKLIRIMSAQGFSSGEILNVLNRKGVS